MTTQSWLWVIFGVVVVGALAFDLGVLQRRAHAMKFAEALGWSAFWIGLAVLFLGLVYWQRGRQFSLEFLTGYLIEESLSVDNLFVFLLIFSWFAVPAERQHGVLFWGILGAIVLRAVFIIIGVTLLHTFSWIVYIFGAILIFSGLKMLARKDVEIRPERNLVLRLFRRCVPVTEQYEGGRFFVRRNGRWLATPLMLVLLVVETADLMFAVDSIPAVLAITTDPFIVYTSNIFAVLGLRALYFALAGLMRLFHHLQYGLAAILVFVGVKMILSHWVAIPIGIALGIVGGILALAVLASLLWPPQPAPPVKDSPRRGRDTVPGVRP